MNIFYLLICKLRFQGVRNARFSKNWVCFVLLPSSWDSPFCLITDELQVIYRDGFVCLSIVCQSNTQILQIFEMCSFRFLQVYDVRQAQYFDLENPRCNHGNLKLNYVCYVMRCAIWYHVYNLKNLKNTLGGLLLLVKVAGVFQVFKIVPMVPNCVKQHYLCGNEHRYFL